MHDYSAVVFVVVLFPVFELSNVFCRYYNCCNLMLFVNLGNNHVHVDQYHVAVLSNKKSQCGILSVLDPVYTVPDPHLHDIQLNSFKTSVALTFMI